MKKLWLCVLAMVLFASGAAGMDYTTNLNMYKPERGTTDWHTYLNSNFDTLDEQIGADCEGTMASIAARLDVCLNDDGTVKNDASCDDSGSGSALTCQDDDSGVVVENVDTISFENDDFDLTDLGSGDVKVELGSDVPSKAGANTFAGVNTYTSGVDMDSATYFLMDETTLVALDTSDEFGIMPSYGWNANIDQPTLAFRETATNYGIPALSQSWFDSIGAGFYDGYCLKYGGTENNFILDECSSGSSGGVYTGVHDFGGATSLEIPNSNSLTVDANGEIGMDTDDDKFMFYLNGQVITLDFTGCNAGDVLYTSNGITYACVDLETQVESDIDTLGTVSATELTTSGNTSVGGNLSVTGSITTTLDETTSYTYYANSLATTRASNQSQWSGVPREVSMTYGYYYDHGMPIARILVNGQTMTSYLDVPFEYSLKVKNPPGLFEYAEHTIMPITATSCEELNYDTYTHAKGAMSTLHAVAPVDVKATMVGAIEKITGTSIYRYMMLHEPTMTFAYYSLYDHANNVDITAGSYRDVFKKSGNCSTSAIYSGSTYAYAQQSVGTTTTHDCLWTWQDSTTSLPLASKNDGWVMWMKHASFPEQNADAGNSRFGFGLTSDGNFSTGDFIFVGSQDGADPVTWSLMHVITRNGSSETDTPLSDALIGGPCISPAYCDYMIIAAEDVIEVWINNMLVYKNSAAFTGNVRALSLWSNVIPTVGIEKNNLSDTSIIYWNGMGIMTWEDSFF